MVQLPLCTIEPFKGNKGRRVRLAEAEDSPDTEQQNGSASPLRSVRAAVASDKGSRASMEDKHILRTALVPQQEQPTSALLSVFDGHGGAHCAAFCQTRLLELITSNRHWPDDIPTSLVEAFVQVDQQYLQQLRQHTELVGESAGTTALAVVVWGNTVYVANAGDSRAVLSRAGRAIDLSVDHKPQAPSERQRIESSGGFYVCPQGRLNGELGVSRAIGDFHLKLPDQLLSPAAAAAPLSPAAAPAAAASQGGMLPSSAIAAADVTITTSPTCSPLTAEPEVTTHQLQADDEFCILGCDGLWDVFSSQRAVEYARASLREHNNPQLCAQELVAEAQRMHSADNITVICCCFGDDPPKRRVYGNGRFSRSVSRTAVDSLAAALRDQQV